MFTFALVEQGPMWPRNKCFKVTEVITDPDETRKIKALLSCISKKQLGTTSELVSAMKQGIQHTASSNQFGWPVVFGTKLFINEQSFCRKFNIFYTVSIIAN